MANFQRLLRIGLSLAFKPARIVEDAVGAVRRTAIFIVCALVAALVVLPAIGCAAAGLWIYVQHQLGPVWAAFITAAAFLIAAVVILLVGIIVSKRRPSKQSSPKDRATNTVAMAVPAALAALAEPRRVASASRGFFNRYKGTALLTAAVVGMVMGQDALRPSLRRK